MAQNKTQEVVKKVLIIIGIILAISLASRIIIAIENSILEWTGLN